MRCLALAQAWQDAGGRAVFAAVEMPESLVQRLAQEEMALHRLPIATGTTADAEATVGLASSLSVKAVVADGYFMGAEFQETIKAAGLRLLFVDDNGHAGRYVADWVL